jgi:hypothetical protein
MFIASREENEILKAENNGIEPPCTKENWCECYYHVRRNLGILRAHETAINATVDETNLKMLQAEDRVQELERLMLHAPSQSSSVPAILIQQEEEDDEASVDGDEENESDAESAETDIYTGDQSPPSKVEKEDEDEGEQVEGKEEEKMEEEEKVEEEKSGEEEKMASLESAGDIQGEQNTPSPTSLPSTPLSDSAPQASRPDRRWGGEAFARRSLGLQLPSHFSRGSRK